LTTQQVDSERHYLRIAELLPRTICYRHN
jgi:hypothetical protein